MTRNHERVSRIRLRVDVENTKPDRRKKYDWTASPTWAAGTTFDLVERMSELADLLPEDKRHRAVLREIRMPGKARAIASDDPRYHAILDASGPVLEDWRRVLEGRGITTEQVVEYLIRHGRLSLADLDRIAEAIASDEGLR